MFRAAASAVPFERGLVSAVREDARPISAGIAVFEAGHPAPNDASVAAGRRSLDLARESQIRGGLLVLLSGGASAMLALPRPGLTLGDKMLTAKNLMGAGAAIHELNCVRKHLSQIKGGQLAAAAGPVWTLALSDVHGPEPDDPATIASGPTVPDPSTFADAIEVIRGRQVQVPVRVEDYLMRGARGEVDETIKPGDPRIADSRYTVVGNRLTALTGAAAAATERGYHTVTIPEATAGEARDAAADFIARASRLAETCPPPLCVMATGETTVTVSGDGLGGRNQEFALSAIALIRQFGETAVLGSAGTDGIDGPTTAAGGIVDTTSLARAARAGTDWEAALARNDSHRFFETLGDLIMWGPTGTNVGDLHVLLAG